MILQMNDRISIKNTCCEFLCRFYHHTFIKVQNSSGSVLSANLVCSSYPFHKSLENVPAGLQRLNTILIVTVSKSKNCDASQLDGAMAPNDEFIENLSLNEGIRNAV